jgi:pseudouridine synthase
MVTRLCVCEKKEWDKPTGILPSQRAPSTIYEPFFFRLEIVMNDDMNNNRPPYNRTGGNQENRYNRNDGRSGGNYGNSGGNYGNRRYDGGGYNRNDNYESRGNREGGNVSYGNTQGGNYGGGYNRGGGNYGGGNYGGGGGNYGGGYNRGGGNYGGGGGNYGGGGYNRRYDGNNQGGGYQQQRFDNRGGGYNRDSRGGGDFGGQGSSYGTNRPRFDNRGGDNRGGGFGGQFPHQQRNNRNRNQQNRRPRKQQRQQPKPKKTSKNYVSLPRMLAVQRFACRKLAIEFVHNSRVRVNNTVITDSNFRVHLKKDKISVDALPLQKDRKGSYVMMYKPAKMAASRETGVRNIHSLVPDSEQWHFPVGRLPKAATGLTIFTDDPAFADPNNPTFKTIEKEYHIKVHKKPSAADLKALTKALQNLDKEHNAQAAVTILQENTRNVWIKAVLCVGRLCDLTSALKKQGLEVLAMHRERIGNLSLANLTPGAWKQMNTYELAQLFNTSTDGTSFFYRGEDKAAQAEEQSAAASKQEEFASEFAQENEEHNEDW